MLFAKGRTRDHRRQQGIPPPWQTRRQADGTGLRLAFLEGIIMTKILITGANGQLGTELRNLLDERGVAYDAFDAKDVDITDQQAVDAKFDALKPTVVCHCATYTAVDKAEDEGKQVNWRVNEEGTRNVATAAKRVGAKLVYISTDYVFDDTNSD